MRLFLLLQIADPALKLLDDAAIDSLRTLIDTDGGGIENSPKSLKFDIKCLTFFS